MPVSKALVAVLVAAGVVGAGAYAYNTARPWVHPIKAADERRYGPLEAGTRPDPQPAPAEPIVAPAITNLFGPARVIDGDTLLIEGVEADLWTIDAPELAQTCDDKEGRPWACGEAARVALERRIGGRQVACRTEGPPPTDGRWQGLCFVTDTPCQGATGACESDLRSLNLALVEEGWAADVEGQYMDAESVAQGKKAGLWNGRFEAPSAWRARQAPAS